MQLYIFGIFRDSIDNIPIISVAKVGSKWFAADNRRLWVFKRLEARGRCTRISVNVIDSIPEDKMTTKNGGESVDVRGDPYVSRTPRRTYLDDSDDYCDSDSDDFW